MAREGVPGIDYLEDNHVEALASAPALASPCIACPYVQGTEASTDPVTSRLARECAKERHSFWCHLTTKGEFATHLCGGWTQAIGACS